jgi:sugar lactone lactonase YvrE
MARSESAEPMNIARKSNNLQTPLRFVWDEMLGALLDDRGNAVGRDQTLPPSAPPRSNADGLVTDDDGRLYALTESGIEVLSPTGQHLGVIPLWCITRRCQNLGFGGSDKRTLYVAGGGTLLRSPMLTRGFQGRAK